MARAGAISGNRCGVTHLTLANYYESGHLRRIAGQSIGDHIAAMKRYWNAVADLL